MVGCPETSISPAGVLVRFQAAPNCSVGVSACGRLLGGTNLRWESTGESAATGPGLAATSLAGAVTDGSEEGFLSS
jgi:hypothetical protein